MQLTREYLINNSGLFQAQKQKKTWYLSKDIKWQSNNSPTKKTNDYFYDGGSHSEYKDTHINK